MIEQLSYFTSQIPSTPIGPVNAAWTAQGLLAVEIGTDSRFFSRWLSKRLGAIPILDELQSTPALEQITEYLHGKRTTFELEIDWSLCTSFQRRVLEQQIAIPYGETRTYGQLAAQIGKPLAARAVGRAGATNPIPLVIPCHRVIGSDGHLRGYGAPEGIKTKAWLLELEKRAQ